MIPITGDLAVDENNISFKFIRSSGPGGQKVNKVSTAVQLRFDVAGSSLPVDIRKRLAGLAGHRMTQEGVLIIKARRFRTQAQNRQDALVRLVELIRRAATKPKPRLHTKPSLASKEKRIGSKRRRGEIKRQRMAASERLRE